MSAVQSIYGVYAENLQAFIDDSLKYFDPLWFPKYFTMAPSQPVLNFAHVIGRKRIEPAASIVDRNSAAPLRTRVKSEILHGQIPAIKEKMLMDEDDYRDYMTIANMSMNPADKQAQLLQLLFNDVSRVGNSLWKRVDIMCQQALSTGTITISPANNPDGIVAGTLDLMMPASNRVTASGSGGAWNNPGATIINDILTRVIYPAQARGIKFTKILIDLPTWYNFINNVDILKRIAGLRMIQANAIATLNIDGINQYMVVNGWPVFEIVDSLIGIESDGITTAIRPWQVGTLSFIPTDMIGVIKNAPAIESLRKDPNISYATINGSALISKWFDNEPWGEWTKGELNAIPVLDMVDYIYLLDSTSVS